MANKDGAVARIREDPEHEEEEVDEIDIDLDALDAQLRAEAIGKSTVVKIGGTVIHIQHAGDWSAIAMRHLNSGDWDAWAEQVILDPSEYEDWVDANLKNYQMEAIASECGRQARLNAGKSRRRSGTSRRGRKR